MREKGLSGWRKQKSDLQEDATALLNPGSATKTKQKLLLTMAVLVARWGDIHRTHVLVYLKLDSYI